MEYVLGLDGSLSNFGISLSKVDLTAKKIISVEKLTLSKTSKTAKVKRAEDDFARFSCHWGCIRSLVEEYKVELIVGELPSGAQDARAAFAFGGVTAMLAGLSGPYKVITVSPAEAKFAATGDKYADKEDIIKAMHSKFPDADWIVGKRSNSMSIVNSKGLFLTNANEHLADALAITIAGINKI